MNYTKGPWIVRDRAVYQGNRFICGAPCVEADVDDTRLIGESWLDMRHRTQPEREAARDHELDILNLIAAAPELLNLVIDAIEDETEFETDWNKQARKLVDRIKGRSND